MAFSTINPEITKSLQSAKKLGFGKNTLEKFFPEVSRRDLAKFSTPNDPGRKIRLIPSDLFSITSENKIRIRRIIMSFFLVNYKNLRDGDLKTRENPMIKKDFTWKDLNPVLYEYFLKQCDIPKEEFVKIRSSIIFPDLGLVNLAHEITVKNFADFIRENKIVYLKDESFNLALLYEQHFIILGSCVCGRPGIFRNLDIRSETGEFKRNYFHCPWCLNEHNQTFYGKLEMQLLKHNDWVGNKMGF